MARVGLNATSVKTKIKKKPHDVLFRIIRAGDDPPQFDLAVQFGHVGEYLC